MPRPIRKDRVKETLPRIKQTYSKYKTRSPQYIDDMVANTNQWMMNKEIAYAYRQLGIYQKMKNTYSVKQARKK